jgi:hypothetical protein
MNKKLVSVSFEYEPRVAVFPLIGWDKTEKELVFGFLYWYIIFTFNFIKNA